MPILADNETCLLITPISNEHKRLSKKCVAAIAAFNERLAQLSADDDNNRIGLLKSIRAASLNQSSGQMSAATASGDAGDAGEEELEENVRDASLQQSVAQSNIDVIHIDKYLFDFYCGPKSRHVFDSFALKSNSKLVQIYSEIIPEMERDLVAIKNRASINKMTQVLAVASGCTFVGLPFSIYVYTRKKSTKNFLESCEKISSEVMATKLALAQEMYDRLNYHLSACEKLTASQQQLYVSAVEKHGDFCVYTIPAKYKSELLLLFQLSKNGKRKKQDLANEERLLTAIRTNIETVQIDLEPEEQPIYTPHSKILEKYPGNVLETFFQQYKDLTATPIQSTINIETEVEISSLHVRQLLEQNGANPHKKFIFWKRYELLNKRTRKVQDFEYEQIVDAEIAAHYSKWKFWRQYKLVKKQNSVYYDFLAELYESLRSEEAARHGQARVIKIALPDNSADEIRNKLLVFMQEHEIATDAFSPTLGPFSDCIVQLLRTDLQSTFAKRYNEYHQQCFGDYLFTPHSSALSDTDKSSIIAAFREREKREKNLEFIKNEIEYNAEEKQRAQKDFSIDYAKKAWSIQRCQQYDELLRHCVIYLDSTLKNLKQRLKERTQGIDGDYGRLMDLLIYGGPVSTILSYLDAKISHTQALIKEDNEPDYIEDVDATKLSVTGRLHALMLIKKFVDGDENIGDTDDEIKANKKLIDAFFPPDRLGNERGKSDPAGHLASLFISSHLSRIYRIQELTSVAENRARAEKLEQILTRYSGQRAEEVMVEVAMIFFKKLLQKRVNEEYIIIDFTNFDASRIESGREEVVPFTTEQNNSAITRVALSRTNDLLEYHIQTVQAGIRDVALTLQAAGQLWLRLDADRIEFVRNNYVTKYLESYTGENDTYAKLIALVATDEQLVLWLKKRFGFLAAKKDFAYTEADLWLLNHRRVKDIPTAWVALDDILAQHISNLNFPWTQRTQDFIEKYADFNDQQAWNLKQLNDECDIHFNNRQSYRVKRLRELLVESVRCNYTDAGASPVPRSYKCSQKLGDYLNFLQRNPLFGKHIFNSEGLSRLNQEFALHLQNDYAATISPEAWCFGAEMIFTYNNVIDNRENDPATHFANRENQQTLRINKIEHLLTADYSESIILAETVQYFDYLDQFYFKEEAAVTEGFRVPPIYAPLDQQEILHQGIERLRRIFSRYLNLLETDADKKQYWGLRTNAEIIMVRFATDEILDRLRCLCVTELLTSPNFNEISNRIASLLREKAPEIPENEFQQRLRKSSLKAIEEYLGKRATKYIGLVTTNKRPARPQIQERFEAQREQLNLIFHQYIIMHETVADLEVQQLERNNAELVFAHFSQDDVVLEDLRLKHIAELLQQSNPAQNYVQQYIDLIKKINRPPIVTETNILQLSVDKMDKVAKLFQMHADQYSWSASVELMIQTFADEASLARYRKKHFLELLKENDIEKTKQYLQEYKFNANLLLAIDDGNSAQKLVSTVIDDFLLNYVCALIATKIVDTPNLGVSTGAEIPEGFLELPNAWTENSETIFCALASPSTLYNLRYLRIHELLDRAYIINDVDAYKSSVYASKRPRINSSTNRQEVWVDAEGEQDIDALFAKYDAKSLPYYNAREKLISAWGNSKRLASYRANHIRQLLLENDQDKSNAYLTYLEAQGFNLLLEGQVTEFVAQNLVCVNLRENEDFIGYLCSLANKERRWSWSSEKLFQTLADAKSLQQLRIYRVDELLVENDLKLTQEYINYVNKNSIVIDEDGVKILDKVFADSQEKSDWNENTFLLISTWGTDARRDLYLIKLITELLNKKNPLATEEMVIELRRKNIDPKNIMRTQMGRQLLNDLLENYAVEYYWHINTAIIIEQFGHSQDELVAGQIAHNIQGNLICYYNRKRLREIFSGKGERFDDIVKQKYPQQLNKAMMLFRRSEWDYYKSNDPNQSHLPLPQIYDMYGRTTEELDDVRDIFAEYLNYLEGLDVENIETIDSAPLNLCSQILIQPLSKELYSRWMAIKDNFKIYMEANARIKEFRELVLMGQFNQAKKFISQYNDHVDLEQDILQFSENDDDLKFNAAKNLDKNEKILTGAEYAVEDILLEYIAFYFKYEQDVWQILKEYQQDNSFKKKQEIVQRLKEAREKNTLFEEYASQELKLIIKLMHAQDYLDNAASGLYVFQTTLNDDSQGAVYVSDFSLLYREVSEIKGFVTLGKYENNSNQLRNYVVAVRSSQQNLEEIRIAAINLLAVVSNSEKKKLEELVDIKSIRDYVEEFFRQTEAERLDQLFVRLQRHVETDFILYNIQQIRNMVIPEFKISAGETLLWNKIREYLLALPKNMEINSGHREEARQSLAMLIMSGNSYDSIAIAYELEKEIYKRLTYAERLDLYRQLNELSNHDSDAFKIIMQQLEYIILEQEINEVNYAYLEVMDELERIIRKDKSTFNIDLELLTLLGCALDYDRTQELLLLISKARQANSDSRLNATLQKAAMIIDDDQTAVGCMEHFRLYQEFVRGYEEQIQVLFEWIDALEKGKARSNIDIRLAQALDYLLIEITAQDYSKVMSRLMAINDSISSDLRQWIRDKLEGRVSEVEINEATKIYGDYIRLREKIDRFLDNPDNEQFNNWDVDFLRGESAVKVGMRQELKEQEINKILAFYASMKLENVEQDHLQALIELCGNDVQKGMLYKAKVQGLELHNGFENRKAFTADEIELISLALKYANEYYAESLRNDLEKIIANVLANSSAFFLIANLSFIIFLGSDEQKRRYVKLLSVNHEAIKKKPELGQKIKDDINKNFLDIEDCDINHLIYLFPLIKIFGDGEQMKCAIRIIEERLAFELADESRKRLRDMLSDMVGKILSAAVISTAKKQSPPKKRGATKLLFFRSAQSQDVGSPKLAPQQNIVSFIPTPIVNNRLLFSSALVSKEKKISALEILLSSLCDSNSSLDAIDVNSLEEWWFEELDREENIRVINAKWPRGQSKSINETALAIIGSLQRMALVESSSGEQSVCDTDDATSLASTPSTLRLSLFFDDNNDLESVSLPDDDASSFHL